MNNKEQIIFAGKAVQNKYYLTSKSNLLVQIKGINKRGKILLFSYITNNEVPVDKTYLLKETNEREVKEFMKKADKSNGKEKGNGKKVEKKKRVSKYLVEFDVLKKLMHGKSVKSKALSITLKKEHRPVDASCRYYVRKSMMKWVKPGTFQVVGK